MKSGDGSKGVAATRRWLPPPSGPDRISWEEFFDVFDKNDLAFLRQEEGESRFNKFVSKEKADR